MTFSVPGYRVEGLLGQGSQSQVWVGRSVEDGARVAFKRIRVDSAAQVRAGRAEAALLAALDHPGLIALRAYLVVQADIVLVLELAGGGSLADLLRRRSRLSAAEVVAAISPVAAALAHAHDNGIMHADVSAANILFTDRGQPKLADLGVARLLAGSGTALGTPAYLDPAVAAGGAPGAASDVFALAAVALHALTGAGPWQRVDAPAASAEQVLAVAATGRIVDLSSRLAGVSPELAAVLRRALDPDPLRRGGAAEFALDLRAALRPEPVMLAGGRIPATLGRHSVELHRQRVAAGWPVSDQPATGGVAAPGAPTRLTGVAADLTQVSRPRPNRAVVEPVAGPRRPLARWSESVVAAVRSVVAAGRSMAGRLWPSNAVWAGAVFALIGVVVIVAVTGGFGHRSGAASAALSQPPASQPPASQPSASQVPISQPPASQAPASPAPAALDPAAVLAGLDRTRAAAYAQRRPELLAAVYRSPSLLAQDRAQLTRTVPAGCRLLGLSTEYRQLGITAGRHHLTVRTTARLAAGSLYCAGTVRGRTPAVGPVRLQLELTDTGAGYLLDGESLLDSLPTLPDAGG